MARKSGKMETPPMAKDCCGGNGAYEHRSSLMGDKGMDRDLKLGLTDGVTVQGTQKSVAVIKKRSRVS